MTKSECRKNDEVRMSNRFSPDRVFFFRHWDFGFRSSLGIQHSSFTPDRLHRIDLRSATSGNPRREQPCEDEYPGSGEKYNRIGRIHFKEHLLQRLSDGVRKKESPGQAESDEPQRVLEHEPNYVSPQGAEGDAQSDFAGSARNEIRLQSVEPDRGHGESQTTERGEQIRAGLKHPQQRTAGTLPAERPATTSNMT